MTGSLGDLDLIFKIKEYLAIFTKNISWTSRWNLIRLVDVIMTKSKWWWGFDDLDPIFKSLNGLEFIFIITPNLIDNINRAIEENEWVGMLHWWEIHGGENGLTMEVWTSVFLWKIFLNFIFFSVFKSLACYVIVVLISPKIYLYINISTW